MSKPGGDPCMGLLLSRTFRRGLIFFLIASVSLFDLTARFFAPTRSFLWPSRTGAVRAGRLFGGHRRLGLDGFEHDGTLDAVGMTIGGEPAFGRGSIAPQPCIRWVQEPEP